MFLPQSDAVNSEARLSCDKPVRWHRCSLKVLIVACLLQSTCRASVAEDAAKPRRVAIRDRAPELTVLKWSDEKSHSLENLRGKTVVLHFWGTWCLPCVKTIPLWKQLEAKYADEDVVFLGIHTAGTDLTSVNEFMQKHDWMHVTAIDRGKETAESATFLRYGVTAVNQIVVIGPDGRVAYNGLAPTQTDGPQAIARLLGVTGPEDETDGDERLEDGIKVLMYMYGKEIEAARR